MAKIHKSAVLGSNEFVLTLCEGELQVLNDILRSVGGISKRRWVMDKIVAAIGESRFVKNTGCGDYWANDIKGSLTINDGMNHTEFLEFKKKMEKENGKA